MGKLVPDFVFFVTNTRFTVCRLESDALRLRSLRLWPSSRQLVMMDRNLLVSLNNLGRLVRPMEL